PSPSRTLRRAGREGSGPARGKDVSRFVSLRAVGGAAPRRLGARTGPSSSQPGRSILDRLRLRGLSSRAGRRRRPGRGTARTRKPTSVATPTTPTLVVPPPVHAIELPSEGGARGGSSGRRGSGVVRDADSPGDFAERSWRPPLSGFVCPTGE